MAEKLTPEERINEVLCMVEAGRMSATTGSLALKKAVEQARREEREKWVQAFSERITLESAGDVTKALTSWEHIFRRAQHDATLELAAKRAASRTVADAEVVDGGSVLMRAVNRIRAIRYEDTRK